MPADLNIEQIKKEMTDAREAVLKDLRSGKKDGKGCAHELSNITDNYTIKLAEHFFAPHRKDMAIVMGGGNGVRKEIYPRSRLNLQIIHINDIHPGFEESFKQFRAAMVGIGFSSAIHMQAMTLPEIEDRIKNADKENLSDYYLHTSLLEQRALWGNQILTNKLKLIVSELSMSSEFYLQGRQHRLSDPGNARHLLNPNIVNGYGGMRDVHGLFWMCNLLGECEDTSGLLSHGLITQSEKKRIDKAYNFLQTLRCHLHDIQSEHVTGKNGAETLIHDHQEMLARRFYPNLSQVDAEIKMMRKYYKATRTIGVLTDIVCDLIAEKAQKELPFLITKDEFLISGNAIRFEDYKTVNALSILRIFSEVQEQGYAIHYSARRAIFEARKIVDEDFRNDLAANAAFNKILYGKGAGNILRQMQQLGFLQQFHPTYADVDAYGSNFNTHDCTVDEHIFRCLEELQNILEGKCSQEEMFAAGLVPRLTPDQIHVLKSAFFLHDNCKPDEINGDITHPRDGAELMLREGRRLGLNEQQIKQAAKLIWHHLRLADHARFLGPRNIQILESMIQFPVTKPEDYFGAEPLTQEDLLLLAVFTAADVKAVNSSPLSSRRSWNATRNEKIRMMYEATTSFISDKAGYIARKIAEKPDLPQGYKFGATHITLTEKFKRAAFEVRIITPDHEYLFEHLVAAFSKEGKITIMSNYADSYKGHEGKVVMSNIFGLQKVDGSKFTPADEEQIKETVRYAASLTEKPHNIRMILDVHKKYPTIKPNIKMPYPDASNNLDPNKSFIKVSGPDRPGFLATIAYIFNKHGLSINSALVESEKPTNAPGGLLIDSFFVHRKDNGGQLQGEDLKRFRDEIYEYVQNPEQYVEREAARIPGLQ